MAKTAKDLPSETEPLADILRKPHRRTRQPSPGMAGLAALPREVECAARGLTRRTKRLTAPASELTTPVNDLAVLPKNLTAAALNLATPANDLTIAARNLAPAGGRLAVSLRNLAAVDKQSDRRVKGPGGVGQSKWPLRQTG